jgi:class 3 adenylate cyclase/tetratricopeptide (TPR) repeat protein/ABC-type cobalamin transport system ATPase subunit
LGNSDLSVAWADEREFHRVSVLFADIAGSTELIQHLDPEGAASIIDPALRAMIEEVERHKGVVRDRGDGIMAIFGAPSVCEDHALRACLAAVAIRDRLADAAHPDVSVRIGVHSGEVVIGSMRIGRSQVAQVSGVSVHVARRLEQTTDPGSICISAAAHDLVRGFVTARPLEPIGGKGLDHPVERFLLDEVNPTADRWRVRAAGGLGAIVNRTSELAVLATMFAAPAASGLRVASLVGPAGIGKSRVLHEFLSGAEAAACGVVRFNGDPHRLHVAYRAIDGWLREAMRITPFRDRPTARGRIAETLHDMDLSAPQTRAIIERLLGLGDGNAQSTAPLYQADAKLVAQVIARILVKWAPAGTTIIACEDIDHFDAASRELLVAMIEELADGDILVITTSRAKTRLRTGRPTRMLQIGPLSDDETATLLQSIDGRFHDQPRLTRRIVEKAAGNPLFVEEVASLVWSPHRDGHVVGPADPAEAELDPAVPDRVRSLIIDRLARLPVEARRLLRICAVIGLDIPLRLLTALTGQSEAGLVQRLGRLEQEQLLYKTRRYPDVQFSFKHALTRDVVYRALLAGRRRDIHGLIVRVLEDERPVESWLDDVCHHALAARLWENAFGYLREAATVAVGKFALQIAHTHLSRAYEIAPNFATGDDLARLQLDVSLELREVLFALGRYLEASTVLESAERLARQLGATAKLVQLLCFRVHAMNILGDLQSAVVLGRRAHEAALSLGDPTQIMRAGHYLGQAHFNFGNLQEADDVLSQVAQLGEQVAQSTRPGVMGTLPVLVNATRMMALSFLGRFDDAVAASAVAHRFARASGRPYDLAFLHSVDCIRHIARLDGMAAEAAAEVGIAIAREAGLEQLMPPLRIGLANARLLLDDLPSAWEGLSSSLVAARESNRFMMQIWASAALALTNLRLGNPVGAVEAATGALAVAEQYHFRGFEVLASRTLGLALLQRPGRRADAEQRLGHALVLAERGGMRCELALCHAALARLGGPDGDRHQLIAEAAFAELGISYTAAVQSGSAEPAALKRHPALMS